MMESIMETEGADAAGGMSAGPMMFGDPDEMMDDDLGVDEDEGGAAPETPPDPENLMVIVHIKDRQFHIRCGPGTQRIIWLAHAALARFDRKFGLGLGVPLGVRRHRGAAGGEELLDSDAKIQSIIKHGEHVFVVLPGEINM